MTDGLYRRLHQRGRRHAEIARRRNQPGKRSRIIKSKSPPLQDVLQGRRFGFNNPTSLSGLIAPARNFGMSPAALMKTSVETVSHRASERAVADGTIDVAAIDCLSWMLGCSHEPAAARLVTAGWTALRPGLPYVTSCHTALDIRAALTTALISLGCFAVG